MERRLHSRREGLCHVSCQTEAHAGFVVVFRRALVDDDVGHSALGGGQGKGGSRID